MRYLALLALVVLTGYITVAGIVSYLVAAVWRLRTLRLEARLPRSRARILFTLRTFPSVAGSMCALLAGFVFLRYEPLQTREQPGVLLYVCAVACIALLTVILVRAARAFVRARFLERLAQHCRTVAHAGAAMKIVETTYPLAAVVGLFRPQLLVSSRIVRECTADEIALIVQHERAHIRGRDNLMRAIMAFLPDPLAVTHIGKNIELSWMLAVEQAADLEAAGPTEEKRAAMAAVLVRIAAMADRSAPTWMPALSFFQGEHLEQRVRELLAAPSSTSGSALSVRVAIAIAGVTAVSALYSVEGIHRAMEWMVRSLP